MKNIKILTSILTSNSHYWCVLKENKDGDNKHIGSEIYFITLPPDIVINKDRDEIKLIDLEQLQLSQMSHNICLNFRYTPFQQGITFYNIVDGFPINNKSNNYETYDKIIKEFLTKSLENPKNTELNFYQKLYDDICEKYIGLPS
jgi:hypothetical protein